jgi:phosphate transport system permease protein
VWGGRPVCGGAVVWGGGSTALRAAPVAGQGGAAVLHLALDEYQRAAWALLPGGEVVAFSLEDGAELERRRLFADRTPTAFHASARDSGVAFGFEDGSVQLGSIGFTARFLAADDPAAADPALATLATGEVARLGAGVAERTPEGQYRVQELAVRLDEPIRSGSESAVVLLTHASSESRTALTVLKADGTLRVQDVKRRTNLLTGAVTPKVTELDLPFEPRLGHGAPAFLLQSDLADSICVAWADGHAVRFDLRDAAAPRIAETVDLVPDAGARLTQLLPLLGSTTLVAADSAGGIAGWFLTRPADTTLGDGLTLSRVHVLPPHSAAVASLAVSARNRMLAAGYADGAVAVFHMTSERALAVVPPEAGPGPGSATCLSLSPRADALLALGAGTVRHWSVSAPSPETSFAALFRPVWYEGASAPAHVWQSSSGTDDFEPKLGLWPLVFGTLKASVYSLLFSVPIALLAAIYTSEFLSRSMRTRIKPVIEIMASLPSVVLGFLAAIVIAPVVEHIVPHVLTALVTVPLAFVVGAHLWQLLPQGLTLRLAGLPRFGLMVLSVFAGLGLAWALAPGVEGRFFAGDIKAWLDGQAGSSVGGWLLLTLPLAVLVVVLLRARSLAGWTRRVTRDMSRPRAATFGLALLAASLGAVAAVALGLAHLLDGAGFDPRGSFVDTYVQRNALIVGFLTGFAVIPIMYTLAEDALSSVPDHLRAASLAAGATPWQTAVRVVVPTAMSGIFSAVMIGIGRVVGETMIVLMAAGNTPVLDWNVFNGFRTLSATIAVELPEAVQDGTLYRVLFLAALTLFAMTFVVNTIAEVVRQRFRKRAYEL